MKKKGNSYLRFSGKTGRRVGALALTAGLLIESLSAGTASVAAAAVPEDVTQDETVTDVGTLEKAAYTDAGTDKFAIGETKTFTFGSAGDVKATTAYLQSKGYGWEKAENVELKNGADYVSGTNWLDATNHVWEYPTFVVDVPVGIYDVTIVQGTDGTNDAVNGAYVEGNMYAVPWSSVGFSTSYDMPARDSWIYTKAGETKESTVQAAVADGQLTIDFATSLTDAGESGTTYIKEVRVTRAKQITDASAAPTLRFIGDSTLAKYPPEDGQVWTPIPERTGWGEVFSMGKFVDEKVVLVNKAVAGSSIKSWVYEGFLNDFLLTSHPGDTVIIEGGINDSAAGRRYSTGAEFKTYLQYFVDVLKAFGLDVIISSGTKSTAEYTAPMQEVATANNLHYVDLLTKWNEYIKANSSKNGNDNLTVDGTHLKRVGGIVAAQLVAADIKGLTGLSISGHIKDIPVNTAAPTAKVSGLKVRKQGSDFVTLAWDIPESTIYAQDQLITGFHVYRKVKGSADAAVKVATQTAYISAGMTGPQLYTTVAVPDAQDYTYYVTVQGVTGEGAASDTLDVSAYVATDKDKLQAYVDQYQTQLFDASAYSVETYAALKVELAKAEALLAKAGATNAQYTSELNKVETAIAALKLNATEFLNTTFADEELKSAAWGAAGTQSGLLSAIMDVNGNRLLQLYVEASGERFCYKEFAGASDINAAVEMVEFEWYPGKPDTRNCTEVEFWSSAAQRVLSLKSACMDSDTGHVGYVVGNYPSDNRYLIGTGFHEYEGSKAVDLGLTSKAWYNVKIIFRYADQKADLYIVPRDDASLDSAIVKDIDIVADANTIVKMNFLMKRGRKDGDTGNDLSTLWDTRIDNYGIYYATAKNTTSASAFNKAVEAYQEKTAGLGGSVLSGDQFVLANAIIDIMKQDVGFFTTADYTYATSKINAAAAAVPVLKNATEIKLRTSAANVKAGETANITATLTPTDANEEIIYTSSDENIASVSGSAKKAVVTAKQAGTVTITATGANSGVSGSVEITVTGRAYFFGTDTTKAYDEESGYGFMNYAYPNAAEGWKEVPNPFNADEKINTYFRRELTQTPGTNYINTSASAKDYLAIGSQVWTELPSGGRDEDRITYENTAAFAADLPNGNYNVAVNFTNPGAAAMDVMVKAEDIMRYSAGDHETAEIATVTVPAGETVAASFDIALTDGQLNLRFEQNSVAADTPAAATDVYVKSVVINEIGSKSAEAAKKTIYTIGDSTVQSYYNGASKNRKSWAQYLYQLFGEMNTTTANQSNTGYDFLETDNVIFRNYARDARSTRSILEEGRLNEVLLNVNDGDYVFMQFAHNDDNAPRVNRYADLNEFKQRISTYDKALAERGATLVLVTPIVIEAWDESGMIDHRFDDYRLAMMQQAKTDNIPVLDLMGATIALVDAMGADNTKNLGIYLDTVHTLEPGAQMFKALMGNLLRASTDEKLAPVKALMIPQTDDNYISIDCAGSLIVDPAQNMASTDLKINAKEENVTLYISDEKVVKYENGKLVAVGEGSAIVTAAYTAGDLATTDCTAYTAYKVINVKGQAADLTELNAAIAAAEQINANDYTTASYAAVKAALDRAKELGVADDQNVIAAAAAALNEAVSNLVKRADRTALNAAIAAAEAKAKADYTADSYAKLESALAAAKAVDPDATAEEIAAAVTALNSAIGALVPVKTDNSETKPSETPSSQAPSSETPSSETQSSQAPAPGKGETFTSSDGVKYKVMTAGKEVAYTAPADKKNITSATIPDTVSVGGVTFKVTSVANKAFEKSSKLKSVTIGKNVTAIGTNAFANCTKLTSVKFKGTKCKTIGTGAFKGAKALKNISIPNSVQKIGDSAFASCTKLETVTIGTGLKEIGKSAFSGDKVLKKITIKSKKLAKVGSNALKSTKKNLTIKVPKKQVKSYTTKFKNKGNKKIKVTK